MQIRDDENRVWKVLVVDDHRTFTDLVALALSGEPDFECVGAAHTAAEAVQLVSEQRPDLVIMDFNLGADDGIEVTERLVEEDPELRVLVLTAHADATLMQRAAAAGACALMPKDGSLPEMLNAMRNARAGGFSVHPELLRMLVARHVPPATQAALLSRRENEVLQLLAHGMDARAIARTLGISLNTCRGYVKTLLMKLDAHSQLEAVAIAKKRGLIDGSIAG